MQHIEPEISVKIFIGYDHEDQELYKKLEDQLSLLKYSGKISIWQDRDVRAGENKENQINIHLQEADLILLLVSANFIASEYYWNKELQPAFQRHEAGTAWVIPIILKPALWEDTPLGQLRALPTGAKPVTQWHDEDAAFADIVRDIRDIVENLQSILRENVQKIENVGGLTDSPIGAYLKLEGENTVPHLVYPSPLSGGSSILPKTEIPMPTKVAGSSFSSSLQKPKLFSRVPSWLLSVVGVILIGGLVVVSLTGLPLLSGLKSGPVVTPTAVVQEKIPTPMLVPTVTPTRIAPSSSAVVQKKTPTPTPTVIPTQIPTSDPSRGGTLVFSDSLASNGLGQQWYEEPAGGCIFANGGLDVTPVTIHMADQRDGYCPTQARQYTDFVFQIDITFLNGSTASYPGYGGIRFRVPGSATGNPDDNNGYGFFISSTGLMDLRVCSGSCDDLFYRSITSGFAVGLNQTNTITVVVKGSLCSAYINGQEVMSNVSLNDNTLTPYTQGYIGLIAGRDTTEAVYKNAKLWKF